ncbi:hypothetical protein FAGAP_10338 [Fusarium agapanthi]|uniref:Uncharacterized protein n=1 Tax=Fusarium agapanthi TaxID=1803897 RepID=A0A9P5B169_9HYPO|nr:hypothetical protein FAGAP_10338 [Fusarium agapanthi]
MEQDQIGRHHSYPLRPFILRDGNGVARPSPPTPPLHDYDFPNHTNDTVYGMNAPIPRAIDNLRNHLPLSPTASYPSTFVNEDLFSTAQSNLGSWPQSPISNSTGFDEEHLPIRLPSLLSERASSPLSSSSESYSESPSCSLSSEKSPVSHLSEPNFTAAFAKKDIFGSIMYSGIKSNALDCFEKQRLAIENTVLSNPGQRTHCWLMSFHTPDMSPHRFLEAFPHHHAEEEYPATELIWEDTSTNYVEHRPILPKVDTQKFSKGQIMYTSMEIEPCNFGPSKTTIASLPEGIRTRIMTFCTGPNDLIALIRSSSVFLQPFFRNRRAIVSQITQNMRLRFGGDMPQSCLMAALLRNMKSKCATGNSEALKAAARRIIKKILFISDTLDTAESVMTGYAHEAWENKFGPLHNATNLVLSQSEKKRFMDAICLYDAYCITFFSENAISSDDDTALRQSFLEEHGIPGEIIKRFYSITFYLHYTYHSWINSAINERYHGISARGKSSSLFLSPAKHIGPLVNHLVRSGPSVFRMLRGKAYTGRHDFLLKSLDRCETTQEYFQKITSAEGRRDKRIWAYSDIALGISRLEVQTANHFWDPVLVESLTPASSFCPTAELQLRSRPNT